MDKEQVIQNYKVSIKSPGVIAFLSWFPVVFYTIFFGSTILIISPIVYLFDKKRALLHTLAIQWAKSCVAALPNITYTVTGRENLPKKDEAVVYIANHQSHSDILALFLMGVPFRWLAKHSLFRIPIFGWGMAATGYVSVNRRDNASKTQCMVKAKNHILNGIPMVFFPEGTRSLTGKMRTFKSGAFVLAQETHVPIIPVAIIGTDKLLPKGKIVPHPTHIRVIIGKAISSDKPLDELKEIARASLSSAIENAQKG